MEDLIKIFKTKQESFIDELFNSYVTVTEKLSGSSFSFMKNQNNLVYFKGSYSKPINLIDRTLMVYYEPAINYIDSKVYSILSSIPDNWMFCFQYFVHNEPGVIRYDNLPKNNLVLTHIHVNKGKKESKILTDPNVILKWSKIFDVTPLIPIFQGNLSNYQKKKIKEFLSLSDEERLEFFNTSSFSSYLISILNPSVKTTTLNNDLVSPIDSFIFTFYKNGTTSTFTSKIIDPYTKNLISNAYKERPKETSDINEILLLDILTFILNRGLKKHEILSTNSEERYIELISTIFNDYVSNRLSNLDNFSFDNAPFVRKNEFDLNLNLIKNQKTKEYLKDSEQLQKLFKIMLGSLKKNRSIKKENSIFTEFTISEFNDVIKKIDQIVNTQEDIEFRTYNDYLNLKSKSIDLFGSDVQELTVNEIFSNFDDFLEESPVIGILLPTKLISKDAILILNNYYEKYKLPIILGLIKNDNLNFITPDVVSFMFQRLKINYPFIKEIHFTSDFNTFKKSVETRYDLNHLFMISDDLGNESIINSLKIDDKETYDSLMPKELHSLYQILLNNMTETNN